MGLKEFIRSVQTYFPWLHDVRILAKMYVYKLLKRPHEFDFYAVKKIKAYPDECYIDVGANRGEAIVSLLSMAPNSNPIVAFEPNPLIFEKLNRFIQSERVHLHNYGLSDTPGSFDLYIPFYRNWMFDGLSSFDYGEAANWLKSRMWRYRDALLRVEKVTCTVACLDDFALKPVFIKIDVQGYELHVLKGAINTLKTCTPIILVENLMPDAKAFLTPLGYSFYTFDGSTFVPGDGSLNTFCITDGMRSRISDAAAT